METIVKNVHLLNGLLSEETLKLLSHGALQYRKFARISFKVLSVDDTTIKVQTVQSKSPHENYADESTLVDRTKDLFSRFLPDHRIIVNPSVYRESPAEKVTPEFIRHNMTELSIKVKELVADTGIDRANIAAWMNGNREMSQPVKAMFYYYFDAKRSYISSVQSATILENPKPQQFQPIGTSDKRKMTDFKDDIENFSNSYQIVRSFINSEGLRIDGVPVKPFNFLDYGHDAFTMIYNSQFEWAYMDLNKNWDGFNIGTCHFFFEDTTKYRAFSDPRGSIKLISMSNSIFNAIGNRPQHYNKILSENPILKPYFGDLIFKQSGTYLMLRFGFLFLYYHELAHIIQNSGFREMAGGEKTNLPRPQIVKDHIEEWDADQFSSSFICKHIIAHWSHSEARHRTIANLEAMVGIALATHFMLMDTFGNGIGDIYFMENDHPHSIVRITGMTAKIIETMVLFHGFNLNVEKINRIFIEIVNSTELKLSHNRFLTELNGNYPEFAEYAETIIEETKKVDYLALQKFKKLIDRKLESEIEIATKR
ncbi:MAG: hypothetical protein J7619_31970 [Dyadobacter sp.]|uniref:hypothetical protein n=1 Tax=Dyadobacter sp. TaxID=1914288 RepID=UPI001B02DD54|nr:hypothetical protein [Dyadobacter sp.]MBO9617343.1 hypothetical protein [Dyadobacter sp.]